MNLESAGYTPDQSEFFVAGNATARANSSENSSRSRHLWWCARTDYWHGFL
jgi:hypothetical protein